MSFYHQTNEKTCNLNYRNLKSITFKLYYLIIILYSFQIYHGFVFFQRIGLTRQLAFGPWEDETSSPWLRSRFYRFFTTSRYLAMLIAVLGIITVAGLVAMFLMKEKELDRRLRAHYGWGSSAIGMAPDIKAMIICVCCYLLFCA